MLYLYQHELVVGQNIQKGDHKINYIPNQIRFTYKSKICEVRRLSVGGGRRTYIKITYMPKAITGLSDAGTEAMNQWLSVKWARYARPLANINQTQMPVKTPTQIKRQFMPSNACCN